MYPIYGLMANSSLLSTMHTVGRIKVEWFDVVPTEFQGSLRPLPGLGFSMQGALCVFTNASLLSTMYAAGGRRRNGSIMSQLSFKARGLCRALVFPCKQLRVFSPFNFITALSCTQASGGVRLCFNRFAFFWCFSRVHTKFGRQGTRAGPRGTPRTKPRATPRMQEGRNQSPSVSRSAGGLSSRLTRTFRANGIAFERLTEEWQ